MKRWFKFYAVTHDLWEWDTETRTAVWVNARTGVAETQSHLTLHNDTVLTENGHPADGPGHIYIERRHSYTPYLTVWCWNYDSRRGSWCDLNGNRQTPSGLDMTRFLKAFPSAHLFVPIWATLPEYLRLPEGS